MKRVLLGLLLAINLVQAGASPLTPDEHRRSEDQTFLTFPEWYLVHSPAEMATYLGVQGRPSEFPWGGHIGQFWQGYAAMTRETSSYPFNGGYHLMVSVIGTSTTVEYGLRAAYESMVGRLAEASAGGVQTPEDVLGARVAQDYVDFIRVDPWYLFDFVRPLRQLWSATPMTGPNILRKWERRFALTTEYLAKAGYAWLIKLGTQSVYEAARPVTAVVLDRAPQPLPAGLPEMQPLAASAPAAVTVPRYRAFMKYAQALAAQDLNFREIAGNEGALVVSLIERSAVARPTAPLRELFVQPVITQPGWERRVVALPVGELAAQLRRWKVSGAEVEHVYDY